MNERQIAIFLFDLDKYKFLLEKETLFSTIEEREETQKFISTLKDYKLISYMLRRIILSKALGGNPLEVSYSYNENGRPYFLNSKLSFNVSHSGRWFLIGLTKKKSIGVDLELVNYIPKHNSFLNTYCSKEQKKGILEYEGFDKLVQTYVDWCLKESFVKARGFGLKQDFKKLIYKIEDNGLKQENQDIEELFSWYINYQRIPHITSSYIVYSFDNELITAITIIDDSKINDTDILLTDLVYYSINPDLFTPDLMPPDLD